MCGIAGILQLNNEPASGQLIRCMTTAMQHRGPDADGFFVEGPMALGHRRLSIIDLSAAANQPFTDPSKRYQLIFNGELYNYKDVRAKLTGITFATSSDTEVLLQAFIRWGIDCISAFKGMFTFAMWDTQLKELYIARDRLGVKPLYYYLDNDNFIFASELRSILATGKVKAEVDENSLIDYFSYQSISSPVSVIKKIKQLEAGHYIKISNGIASFHQYWDITKPDTSADYGDLKRVQQNILNLLTDAVSKRLISDVPFGAFLSGGIDSSAIVGLMAAVSHERPNTFTVSFAEKDYDESAYAEMVAKKFNTRHQNILLSPHVMLDELTNALDAMDTPSGDGINSYVVSKAVKHAGITVALSGVGGDELFAGYPFFKKYSQLHQISFLWKNSALARNLVGKLLPGKSIRQLKLKEILELKSSAIESAYPVIREILSPQQISELVNIEANQSQTGIEKKLAEASSRIRTFPSLSQVSIAEFLGYTQQTLLKDMDQMSMAVSLEVREPFFDHQLVEYVLGIPDKYKDPVYPKKLLVESLGNLLPVEIVHRKKQGFVFPWAIWMRSELKEFCNARIERMSERSFINGNHLKQLWIRFLKGDPLVRWLDIWLFVVLEYWIERNID